MKSSINENISLLGEEGSLGLIRKARVFALDSKGSDGQSRGSPRTPVGLDSAGIVGGGGLLFVVFKLGLQ